MEFPFDINSFFGDQISVLDQNLAAPRKCWGRADFQHQMATVIDELGKASAKSQQLQAPITSAVKMQSSRHHLYVLKDGEANNGRGVAIGLLKVGYKKLFVLDHGGAHNEVEPLCVLDFYIHESLQRHGYGKRLFNHMLENERVEAQLLAYDRPSQKFLSFLRKHYGLAASVPQVNNFVVFDGFFRGRSVEARKLPPKRKDGEIKPYSLTDREVLKEEEKGLPWPFSQSPSLTRSHSVGSSPSRHPPHTSPSAGLREPRMDQPGPRLLNGDQHRNSAAELRRRTSSLNRFQLSFQ